MASMVGVLSTAGGAEAAAQNNAATTARVAKQAFTPEVLNQFGRVSSPQVSPDGKKILFAVNQIDIKKNKGNNDLWVMDIDGKNLKQITNTPRSEGNPVWIEGGNKIAFTYCDTQDGAVTQVWTMNADGTDRKCISSMEKDVEGFTFSPDEKKIVIVSTVK